MDKHHVSIKSKGFGVSVTVDDETISELFASAFEGWCPVCQNHKLVAGAIICCSCLDEAVEWHERNCVCCPATYSPKEAK